MAFQNLFMPGGGKLIAAALQSQSYVWAISTGQAAWDGGTFDPVEYDSTLQNVIGFVRPTKMGFAAVAPDGDIHSLDDQENPVRYKQQEAASNIFIITLDIPVDAFPGQKIREIGLCSNPVFDAAVLPGQMVAPADKVTFGELVELRRFTAVEITAQSGPLIQSSIILP